MPEKPQSTNPNTLQRRWGALLFDDPADEPPDDADGSYPGGRTDYEVLADVVQMLARVGQPHRYATEEIDPARLHPLLDQIEARVAALRAQFPQPDPPTT
jgi:hypothetical protein